MGQHRHKVNRKSFFGRPVWRNSVGNVKAHPLEYLEPKDLNDLLKIVNEAIETGMPVRAVGSGHSYSTAPHTDGLLIDTSSLNKNLGFYQRTCNKGHFVEFEGGIKVHDLNEELDKMGLSIPTMGGIDHQALAGALQTGTHGSNLIVGAMSAIVRSMVIVTNDLDKEGAAKAYRIEKSEGLTDRHTYPSGEPELIQDDEVFNSVAVCFGTMGIVYSLVIEVEPLFYLEECKKADTWPNVKKELQNGLLHRHQSVYVQINPYMVKGERAALVVTHDRTTPRSKRERIKEDVKRNIFYRIGRAMRNPISELFGNIPILYWVFVALINSRPKGVPKLINQAIRNQQDKSYVNKSHKVMYQGLDYVKERAYDAEFAITIENDKYLELVEDLMVLLTKLHERFRFQLSSPLGLRFVKRSEIFLTPENGTDVCYVDAPVLKHAFGNEVLLYNVQKLFMQYGARPHWGKMNEVVDRDYIRTSYPKFDNWYYQFTRFNRNGIFSNRFSRQMIGEEKAEMVSLPEELPAL